MLSWGLWRLTRWGIILWFKMEGDMEVVDAEFECRD